MTPKEFEKYLVRDRYRCLHCGLEDSTLIPQHRLNRGMGGSKARDVSSNIIVLCSKFNWLIEADPIWAKLAIERGWKLKSGQVPKETPVYDSFSGSYYLLDDSFGKELVQTGDLCQ
jgi:hypothetical protein